MLAKLFTAVAVASMATAPVLAASPAASLSLSRAATASEEKSDLAPAVLVGVLATAALIGGAIILANSDDTPDSP